MKTHCDIYKYLWKKIIMIVSYFILLNLIYILSVYASNANADIEQTFYRVLSWEPESRIFEVPNLTDDISTYTKSFDATGNVNPFRYYYEVVQPIARYREWYGNYNNEESENIELLFNDETFEHFWLEASGGKTIEKKYLFDLGAFPGDCAVICAEGEYYYIPFLKNGDQYGELINRQIYTLEEFKLILEYQPVEIIANDVVIDCTVSAYVTYGDVYAPLQTLLSALGYEVLYNSETKAVVFCREGEPYYKITNAGRAYYLSEIEEINFDQEEFFEAMTNPDKYNNRVHILMKDDTVMIYMGNVFMEQFINKTDPYYNCELRRDLNQIHINSIPLKKDR